MFVLTHTLRERTIVLTRLNTAIVDSKRSPQTRETGAIAFSGAIAIEGFTVAVVSPYLPQQD